MCQLTWLPLTRRFVKDTDSGHITLSPICSPAKPVPEFCVPHLNKHKKRSRAAAAVNKPHGARPADKAEVKQGVAPKKCPKNKASEQSDETQLGTAKTVVAARPLPPTVPIMSQAERIKKKQELDEQKRQRVLALAPRPIVIPAAAKKVVASVVAKKIPTT